MQVSSAGDKVVKVTARQGFERDLTIRQGKGMPMGTSCNRFGSVKGGEVGNNPRIGKTSAVAQEGFNHKRLFHKVRSVR